MSAKKRKRDVPVLFWVSDARWKRSSRKWHSSEQKNLSAYLRKMAVDGYVVQLDLPELKEQVSLLRRSSNNLNQLTRRVHETGRIYDAGPGGSSPTAGAVMGGRERNPNPAFQAFVTGIYAPTAEGGTAVLFAAAFLRFFFCPYPCLFEMLEG